MLMAATRKLSAWLKTMAGEASGIPVRQQVDFFIAMGKSYAVERRTHFIKLPVAGGEEHALKRLRRVYPKARKIEVISVSTLVR